ncbi:hypothetical protein F5Y13DRAFT_164351 [Hypoxylon sp. FL1857]|nr:hypothetical protein F5Y13DRAFT_164351 [Hypoxylon sp. FL1857]
MSDSEGDRSPVYQFCDEDGGRPFVAEPTEDKKTKFCRDDKVHIIADGTRTLYVIASVVSTGKYTLCSEDGTQTYNDGQAVNEDEIESATSTT